MDIKSGNSNQTSVSDAAVKAKTGKTWNEWFEIMDAAGCNRMDHKSIVAFLADNYRVDPWWQQQVTVTYEQARGLRKKYQTSSGFQASSSKTINSSVSALYAAWVDENQRTGWLPERTFTIRKATQDKSLRITWADGSNVEAYFYPKGDAKSQVTVQHSKLENADSVAQVKQFWKAALQRLKSRLEDEYED
ncbi:MAG: DUF4287 domain-containing protein [Anaerolineales bacterium]|nr:DUF4287 domain-containing protein [Anaerolineales bacterium]